MIDASKPDTDEPVYTEEDVVRAFGPVYTTYKDKLKQVAAERREREKASYKPRMRQWAYVGRQTEDMFWVETVRT